MEADPEGECSEQQQKNVTESSIAPDPSASGPHPAHRSRGRLQHRSPRSPGLLLRFQQQQAIAWQPSESAGTSGGSFLSPSSPSSFQPSTSSTRGNQGHVVQAQSSQDPGERPSSPKRGERKPQKPGKYVCSYCGRPCAKPSVLQKHIRSHTGERPYPCDPCGFSFKTKSNLYKHRKSHAHRIKAGLMSCREELSRTLEGVGEEHEEPTEGDSTESEEETGNRKTKDPSHQRKEESQRVEDSHAIKQRLALRLSERKRGLKTSSDDLPSSSLSTSSSSLGPGSKGSTESGYFSGSGSGSTDLSQMSPPTASAKSYAEIILGKYGRLGGQQRGGHQQQPQSLAAAEEKSITFTVPKTQVIDHITKLITINEAVVDTSEIDSVKPRRSSLSRKSSTESPKTSSSKDPYTFDPKSESLEPVSSVPLLRSHSLPSSSTQEVTSSSPRPMSPGTFRLCQSFDEQQAAAAEMRVGHVQRMLRRQPAIEVPLGSEVLEDVRHSSSAKSGERKRQQKQQLQKSPCLLECEACGCLFQHSEGCDSHVSLCSAHKLQPEPEVEDKLPSDPQVMMQYKLPALTVTVRKRRKEESLEEDPSSPTTRTAAEEGSNSQSGVQSEPIQQQQDRQGVSVIQHTSSFEKQESMSMESHESDVRETEPEPKPSPSTSRLIRQPNIQVPEILVTLEPDTDMPPVSPTVTVPLPKEVERVEEFQWPQRSQSLAQLPAEKLPPKKKRLRLAEAAQSSGESSFESMSVSRSPSQESNLSLSSSVSVSLDESIRPEAVVWAAGSQSSQMLMVPSASHQFHQSHKEMRRSASEQTTTTHQQPQQIPENRSKSFDYGSLSSQQPTTSWKERRKCLLVKHATLGDPEEEHRADSPRPGPSHVIHHPLLPTEEWLSQEESRQADPLSLIPRDQQTSAGSLSNVYPVPTEVLQRAFYDLHGTPFETPLHDILPLQFSSHCPSLYSPFSSRPLPHACTPPIISAPYHNMRPIIATCLAQLTPAVSLVVPVRLETHIPTYASAMYTTLSRILASALSPEPICTTMVVMSQLDQSKSYLTVPALKMKTPISLMPSLASIDDEAWGPLGVGGSKRMLSPAASLELSTEAQRQQKRVKEEEEGEQGSTAVRTRQERDSVPEEEDTRTRLSHEKNQQQNTGDKSLKEVKKQEETPPTQNTEVIKKKEVVRSVSPSYPSLHTSTSVNWCYLNYTKPTPSTQRDPQTSVYTSWSVSPHNPNLPGFNTKTAMSLLCSKQRHSVETYTMATASRPKEGRELQETQVQITPPPDSPAVPALSEEVLEHEQNTQKTKRHEDATTSRSRESSCVRSIEGGFRPSDNYVYVRGRGRGRFMCAECGIRCKKPSMLKKHIRTHSDLRPYICKYCNFAFKTKGNLTKHMKSKAHGKKCQSVGVHESSLDEESEETGGSEEPAPDEEHQFSDVDDSEDDEDEDEESTAHDDTPSSCSSDTQPTTCSQGTPDRELPGPSVSQGTPDRELTGPSVSQPPSPRGRWSLGRRASSPGSRRALFSRQGIRAARALSQSSESCSPSRSLSPRLELSPVLLSLSPRTELSSPERGESPIRPMSPQVSGLHRSPRVPTPPSPLRLPRRVPGALPWESPAGGGAQGKEDKCGIAGEADSSSSVAFLRLSPCELYPPSQSVDPLFSHLPLHSQHTRLPCVMIPIGGIQMVQARPRARTSTGTPSSPTSPPVEGCSRLSFDSPYWGGMGAARTSGFRASSGRSFEQTHGERTEPKRYAVRTQAASVAECSQGRSEEPSPGGVVEKGAEHSDHST
ncbi:unnamed protein product [Knipowitschia caucasica]